MRNLGSQASGLRCLVCLAMVCLVFVLGGGVTLESQKLIAFLRAEIIWNFFWFIVTYTYTCERISILSVYPLSI